MADLKRRLERLEGLARDIHAGGAEDEDPAMRILREMSEEELEEMAQHAAERQRLEAERRDAGALR